MRTTFSELPVGVNSDATADLATAIRLDPNDARLHRKPRPDVAAKRDYEGARRDFAEAVRLDPNDRSPRVELAWLAAACPDEHFRDGPKAIELATEACQLSSWKDVGSIAVLAAGYAETGDFISAVKWEEKVAEMVTSDTNKTRVLECLSPVP